MYMNAAFDNVCFKGSVVSQSARFVYLCLCKHADNTHQTCFPSLSRIAEIVGKSISTVKRAIRELCKYGVIERNPRYRKDGGQTSNLYKINECFFNEHINLKNQIDKELINSEEIEQQDISLPVSNDNQPLLTYTSEQDKNCLEAAYKINNEDDNKLNINDSIVNQL